MRPLASMSWYLITKTYIHKSWHRDGSPFHVLIEAGMSNTLLSGFMLFVLLYFSLRWHRNEHVGVSNHQPHHCLLNRLFGCKSKKTSKLRATGLCAGNSPGTGEFPAQMASNTENVSLRWRHHACLWLWLYLYPCLRRIMPDKRINELWQQVYKASTPLVENPRIPMKTTCLPYYQHYIQCRNILTSLGPNWTILGFLGQYYDSWYAGSLRHQISWQ